MKILRWNYQKWNGEMKREISKISVLTKIHFWSVRLSNHGRVAVLLDRVCNFISSGSILMNQEVIVTNFIEESYLMIVAYFLFSARIRRIKFMENICRVRAVFNESCVESWNYAKMMKATLCSRNYKYRETVEHQISDNKWKVEFYYYNNTRPLAR